MKAHVYVTLKRTVLDAQGQTVADALRRMEYRGIADVRQGKYFLLTLEDGLEQKLLVAMIFSTRPHPAARPDAYGQRWC
jgi:phosphoribosylformylglycinamidine synthase PurS subunit